MITGIDVSHWQGTVDWAAVRRAGHEFAIVKATEATNYTDPTFTANRTKARAAGLITGFYHFARAGNPVAEARHFVDVVGDLAVGEFLVLDWEVPGNDPPAWCLAWLQLVTQRLGARPLVYMNASTARAWKWKTVEAAGYQLWLAKYDQSTANPGVVGDWSKVAMKQHTDKGLVPGVQGPVDMNVFYGDKAALSALAKGGSPAGPLPNPNEEDQMIISQQQWDELDRKVSLALGVEIRPRYPAERTPGEQVMETPVTVPEVGGTNFGSLWPELFGNSRGTVRALGSLLARDGDGVDEAAIVQLLAPIVIAAIGEAKGLTAADVEAAVKRVFADAAS